MASTTEPRRSPEHRPTRRALLASAALVAPASFLPAIAAATGQEPDPHPAWFAEWRACLDHMNGPAGAAVATLAELPEWGRMDELEGLITATLARTPAGVLAQLRIIAHW